LVLVGHSFGSFISHGLIAKSPEIADGVILTGLAFAMNSAVSIEAFVLRVAAQQDNKFSDRDDGYVTWADVYANINK
jgi:pimeloyl-ACP methyl ester carboxylesterase